MLDKIYQLREQLAHMERRGASTTRRGENGSGACSLPSGHAVLDASLPAGGWPFGALTELLSDSIGTGELQLLLPALSQLAHAGRCIAWVAPPYLPYAPALVQQGLPLERLLMIRTTRPQESLWAIEQALRCPAMGAVLGWTAHIVDRSLRRLQLAAQVGGTLGILHRPAAAADESSPAALRLRLCAVPDGLVLELKKVRGGRAGARLHLTAAHLGTPFGAHPGAYPGGRTMPPADPNALAMYSSAGAGA
jgi:cell division inhibitor SulA/protein ImuA